MTRCVATGVTRQKVELLLPGDTDGSGYPGGIKQQFVAVRDMVEAILLQLKQLPDFQVLHIPQSLTQSIPDCYCEAPASWASVMFLRLGLSMTRSGLLLE